MKRKRKQGSKMQPNLKRFCDGLGRMLEDNGITTKIETTNKSKSGPTQSRKEQRKAKRAEKKKKKQLYFQRHKQQQNTYDEDLAKMRKNKIDDDQKMALDHFRSMYDPKYNPNKRRKRSKKSKASVDDDSSIGDRGDDDDDGGGWITVGKAPGDEMDTSQQQPAAKNTSGENERPKRKRKKKKKKQKVLKLRPAYASESEEDEQVEVAQKPKDNTSSLKKKSDSASESEEGDDNEDYKNATIAAMKAANKKEDAMIKSLEKQMGLKKRKSKSLPKSFMDEGLDYILDAVDSEKMKAFYQEEEIENIKNLDGDDVDSDSDVGNDDVDMSSDDAPDEMCSKTKTMVPKKKKVKKKKSEKQVRFADDKEDAEEDDDIIAQYESGALGGAGDEESDEEDVDSGEDDGSFFDESDNEDFDDDDVQQDDDDDSMQDDNDDDDDDVADDNDDDDDTGGSDDVAVGSEDSDDDEQASEDEEEEEEELKEDIYGRLRDRHGNIVSSTKYIPPAKRLEMANSQDSKYQEKMLQLKKQIRGQVNRLSEANMSSIASYIENIFRSNSRALVSEVLCSCIIDATVSDIRVPERLSQELIMLLTMLHANVGTEIGALFLEKIAKLFDSAFKAEAQDKTLDNVIVVMSNIYNFKIIHSVLIFDILKKLTERFSEQDIEGILTMLKNLGFTLRKDDPAGLKQILLTIQSKAQSLDKSLCKEGTRVAFMLEVLMAIKNNNMRKIPSYDPQHLDHLRKLLRGFVKSSSDYELRIGLEDLLQAETRGKWWIVGSAWSGGSGDASGGGTTTAGDWSADPEAMQGFDNQLMELARKQRMNTDLRKNLFCVIMSAEDYLDAFEKLLRLGLKHQQEFEIIHVVMDLCLREKTYNPFYSYLAQKFCEYHRRFQMTIQFTTWDKFKDLSSLSESELHNLALFLTHQIAHKAISLSIFKVVQFGELDKWKVKFMCQILKSLLIEQEEETVREIFQRIVTFPKLDVLREGLKVFMRHFLLKGKNKQNQVLTERIELVEHILSMGQRRPVF